MSIAPSKEAEVANKVGYKDTPDQRIPIPAVGSDVSSFAKASMNNDMQVVGNNFSVEIGKLDMFSDGAFVAALSYGDRSTPFWVGKIVPFAGKQSISNPTNKKLVRVQWYQASGSAKDPFDAAYIPARRSPMIAGESGDVSFWESTIGVSEIITTFVKLSSESRLDLATVARIKEKI